MGLLTALRKKAEKKKSAAIARPKEILKKPEPLAESFTQKEVQKQEAVEQKEVTLAKEQVRSKKSEMPLDIAKIKEQLQVELSLETPKIKEIKSEQNSDVNAKTETDSGVLVDNGEFDLAAIKAEIEGDLKKLNSNQQHVDSEHERLLTGIPGLDEVIQGGIRQGSATLVGGGAGSGKSIFAMQFLVNGISMANQTGVYISFEQTEEEMLESFEPFHWGIAEKIKNKQIALLHNTPEQVEKVLESGGGIVRDVISSINAKRVVIDSLTAFSLLFKTDFEKRRALLRLFEAIRGWGCTTLMISEQEPDPEHHVSTVLEFAVDGVILLYNVRKGDIRERSLEVFKMRATDHHQKIFPMRIDDTGVTIFPNEVVF